MNIYEELGVVPVINAAGTYTAWGGSCMSAETLSHMAQAAQQFVSIRELQAKVHEKIAQLTSNEAAYVSNGAATGLYLAVAACVERKARKPFYYLDRKQVSDYNVAVFRSHRNPYDMVIQHLGVNYSEIGFPNIILPATEADIEQTINERTVAFYFAYSTWTAPGDADLETVIRICQRHDIPVIVDAAAQLPPKENLWKFTEMGASLVLFSGGKYLRGPQSSGLVVGRKELVDMITSIGFPNYGIGRMMKVGREELIGLYSAIKQYVQEDEAERRDWCEKQVEIMIETLSARKEIKAAYSFPNEAGQPIPRVCVQMAQPGADIEWLYKALLDGTPRILTGLENNCLFINPMTMKPDDTPIILEKITELLEEKR